MIMCIIVCVPRFTDPQHWLQYFPPLTKADLKALGIRVGLYCLAYVHYICQTVCVFSADDSKYVQPLSMDHWLVWPSHI